MLSRFLQAKNEEKKKPKERRPFLASECRDLADADKWRQQIIREIGRKVMDIQNPGLGEHRLRDLNDEINKLIREKGHWEARILELGGPNYAKTAPKVTDEDGKEVRKEDTCGRPMSVFMCLGMRLVSFLLCYLDLWSCLSSRKCTTCVRRQ
jgi:pre-mRNA-splicing factor ISY1